VKQISSLQSLSLQFMLLHYNFRINCNGMNCNEVISFTVIRIVNVLTSILYVLFVFLYISLTLVLKHVAFI